MSRGQETGGIQCKSDMDTNNNKINRRKKGKPMRKPMVTRTIKATSATILCVNLETNTTLEQLVILSRTYKNDTAILVKAKTVLPEHLTPVKVLNSAVETRKMGMTEDEFIELARVLNDDEDTADVPEEAVTVTE